MQARLFSGWDEEPLKAAEAAVLAANVWEQKTITSDSRRPLLFCWWCGSVCRSVSGKRGCNQLWAVCWVQGWAERLKGRLLSSWDWGEGAVSGALLDVAPSNAIKWPETEVQPWLCTFIGSTTLWFKMLLSRWFVWIMRWNDYRIRTQQGLLYVEKE